MSDIEIEIDGKPLKAKPNSMVIQVADEAGIYIPRFCYHKHLSVAANCRMCLVEVDKSPKALPACATPVMPGMKVFTRSPKAIAAQKAVMEFLLINHPLDCPICDQGGECELQDLSLGFGSANSNYTEGKRSIKDQDIGPLIATDMTRCIYCTRCVRFGAEIAGMRELGATGRGEHTEIGTFVAHAIHSEVSGNVIDLCPVGALTSKPFRFSARAWELNQYPTIAAHDCIGSHVNAHTRNGYVMRVVPRENNDLNQTWISDRDRFSYEGLYHVDRLTKPRIRVDGEWQDTDWQTALEFAVTGLQRVILSAGADRVSALASPNSTTEEFYLLQKLMRALGSHHVDHRLRQTDFSDQASMPTFPKMDMTLSELENCDVIILVGSNIQKEQPIASLRVRKASLNGAEIVSVNMMDYPFNFSVTDKKIVAPHHFVRALASVAKISEQYEGKKVAILMGAAAMNHPEAANIRAHVKMIAKKCHASVGYLTEGANSAGAWLAGFIPHRKAGGITLNHAGCDVMTSWNKKQAGYVLLNVEPDVDCANSPAAVSALEQADFVVSLSVFNNPVLAQFADVILPITPFTETSGTFVNALGDWQSFKGAAQAFGESRPGWKVLRVLGNLFHCEGFDYESSEEIRDEVKALTLTMPHVECDEAPHEMALSYVELSRIGDIPLYSGDNVQRRARALQETQTVIEGELAVARLNPQTALKLGVQELDKVTLKQQDQRISLQVWLDERVPEQAVFVAGGITATNALGELFGSIEIAKA